MMKDIGKIGIVGAGVMGGEIAYVASQAGIGVVVKDIDGKCLDAALEKVREIYEFKVKRRRMSREDMESRLALVSVTLGYDEFCEIPFVIEAVTENMDVKRAVFAQLESVCAADAVLVSNTSALSITEIARGRAHRGRIAGMHFFNPVSMMRLVEVISGAETSEETAGVVAAVAERLGKVAVRCADAPGFIVNRLLCAAMYEAIRCEAEGVYARDQIDSALISPHGGLPTGLFRMADMLGIDLLYKAMTAMQDALGARFPVPEVIRGLHADGAHGVRARRGFYKYMEDGSIILPAGGDRAIDSDSKQAIAGRVLLALYAEALRLADAGVATPDDIDDAMRYGALFKRPPFEFAASLGEGVALETLAQMAARHGPQFDVGRR